VTEKRERVITDPGLGPVEPPGPSTLRSLEAAEDAAELSPNAPVYYEPSPLVAVSDHKTLEVQTVKLSDEIDPRKLQTELRMDRVQSFVPASDSFWPPETALASSQPPPGPVRRWRAPVVLIALLCGLLLLVVGRAVSRRSAAAAARQSGIVQTVSGAGLAPVVASALPAVVAPVRVAEPPAAPAASELTPPPAPAVADSAPPRVAANLAHVAAAPRPAKPTPQLSAPLAASSASKPKRAIY